MHDSHSLKYCHCHTIVHKQEQVNSNKRRTDDKYRKRGKTKHIQEIRKKKKKKKEQQHTIDLNLPNLVNVMGLAFGIDKSNIILHH